MEKSGLVEIFVCLEADLVAGGHVDEPGREATLAKAVHGEDGSVTREGMKLVRDLPKGSEVRTVMRVAGDGYEGHDVTASLEFW